MTKAKAKAKTKAKEPGKSRKARRPEKAKRVVLSRKFVWHCCTNTNARICARQTNNAKPIDKETLK